MEQLSNTIEIKVLQNSFTTKFPTIGQEIDIENSKLRLSGGMFTEMIASNPRLAITIEAIATFSVLIPDLKKHLNGFTSFFELTREQVQAIVDAYTEQYQPWYRKWEAQFNKVIEDGQKAQG